MELSQLRYFYAAAKCEHITHAAESLHIAQPALTQSIHRLESELGVNLFIRRGRSIALSECGEYLYKQLGELLPVLDRLPEELKQVANLQNRTIRLNILAASMLVTDFIIGYKRENPDVNFNLRQDENDKNCDCSISTVRHKTDGIAAKGVTQLSFIEEIRLAVPYNSVYAYKESIDLWSVRNEGFIILSAAKPFHNICESLCCSVGFSPNVILESDSPSIVRDLIGAGMGIGFWPAYSWGAINTDYVRLIPIFDPVCRREITFTCHTPENELAYDFYCYMTEKMKNML